MTKPDPIDLYRPATANAVTVAEAVRHEQLDLPTPCSAWSVQELVEACIAMFLPDMPGRGRAAGIVGPAVVVGDDATPQERPLAAMGRTS